MRLYTFVPLLALVGTATIGMASRFDLNGLSGRLSVPTPTWVYFAEINRTVAQLAYDILHADHGTGPDFGPAEKGLVQLAKATDQATSALDNSSPLSLQEIQRIEENVVTISANIKIITDAIKALKPYADKYQFSPFITYILQSEASQFDVLASALGAKARGFDVYHIFAYFVKIICSMDSAAVVMTPGAHLTGEQFCSWYVDKDSDPSSISSKHCPKKPFPKLSKSAHGFKDCGQSTTNSLDYAYGKKCFASPDVCKQQQWCKPPFKQCDKASWRPKQYLFEASM